MFHVTYTEKTDLNTGREDAKKIRYFGELNSEPTCFIHVLLRHSCGNRCQILQLIEL